ncbi:MAG: RNA polymerase sigma factor [Verrucomicrobiales bacterium]
MTIPQTDAELVSLAQSGDKRAFVPIVARHQSMVYGVALGILGDFAASEDAAQEAFVLAWRRLSDLQNPEKLRGWLARIARNAALGQRRRNRNKVAGPLEEEDVLADEDRPSPDVQAAHEEEAALVRSSLARLPETYRLPLVMFYCQDRSVREVAEALDLSEEAVRKRIARGRELLRERIAGLVESTLQRAQPGALFTVAIAAAIGALASPTAMASGAFAAAAAAGASTATTATAASSATSSAATATTAPVVTAMTTAKATALAAALAAAACFPIGYAVHSGFDPPVPSAPARPAAVIPTVEAGPADFSGSELFAEWVRLHDDHGHDAEAMPALFKAISGLKDTFRRRAFRAALAEEWAQVDPAGGLEFFLGDGGNRDAAHQLFRTWLMASPSTAMAKLTALGPVGDSLAGELDMLSEIARRAPEHVVAIAARLSENSNYWHHPVTDAFVILANQNLEAARQAAEELTGARRGEALAGVAKAWGSKDFEAAANWARSLPEGTDRDGILRQALTGLAASDPTAALAKSDVVPPGGRMGYFADTTAARLLKATTPDDFEDVAGWLRDHPGKISGEDVVGLSSIVSDRLNENPAGFLDRLAAQGTLAVLGPALGSALLNESKPQLAAVWEWLKSQPESPATQNLRQSVLNSAGWQNPDLAFSIALAVPDSQAGRQALQQIANSLLNGGQPLGRIDELLAGAPARLRDPLLVAAFQTMNPDGMSDPAPWLRRLSELPAEHRTASAAPFAGAWAYRNPEAAASWAAQLPADGGRLDALRTVAGTWLRHDSLAASEWIAQLPAGAERDAGATVLVHAMAGEPTNEAWHWAVSITEPQARLEAARTALAAIAPRDPAEAMHWIDTSALAEAEKNALKQAVARGELPPIRR